MIWPAASAPAATSEFCASRALLRIMAAVSAPTADRARSTSLASDLTCSAACVGRIDEGVLGLTGPGRDGFGGRCAGDRQAFRDIDGERLDVLGGFRGGIDERVLGLARPGRDGLGGGRPGERQRSATSAASDLTCFAASEDELTRVFWASRAPAVRVSAVDLPAADRLTATSDGQQLDVLSRFRRRVDQVVLGLARAGGDGLGGGLCRRSRARRRRRPRAT